MSTGRKGFTLIELMIVIAIIAIIGAIAIPSILQGRVSANEAAAVGSLKTIASSQAMFREARKVDQNQNGVGEYGLLGELAGELALRPAAPITASPPYISQEFRTGGSAGVGYALKAGYCYRIYLANAATYAQDSNGNDQTLGGTSTAGGAGVAADVASIQERAFAIYAWPMDFSISGKRAFFISEAAQVYVTNMTDAAGTPVLQYNGTISQPHDYAAYIPETITGSGTTKQVFGSKLSSKGTAGQDGNQWNPVGG
jgi:prepilin-type N-terminal cleavage/methylation domain-containing protein